MWVIDRARRVSLVVAFAAMGITQAITENEGWAWVAFFFAGTLFWVLMFSALRSR